MAIRCCPPVAKATDPARRSTRALTARERAIYQAFLDAAANLQAGVDSATTRRLIAQGIEAAMGSIDTGGFVSALGPMVDAIQAEVAAGGTAAMSELTRLTGVSGLLRFDVLDPRALAWAETQAGRLIRQVTDEQRDILRRILARSVENGWTVAQTTQDLRQVVGLHDRWATAVLNAKDRELERLLNTGMSESLARDKADVFADRYRQRLVQARAKNIARTEILTASNQGRYLSWAQGVEQGHISPVATKEWSTGPLVTRSPGRIQVCELCQGVRGEQRRWDEEFSLGVMMPPGHPACRCTAVLVPASIEEVRRRLREADGKPATQVTPAASRYGPGPNGVQRFEDVSDIQVGQKGRLKERSDAMKETTQVMDRLHGASSSMSRVEIKLGGKALNRGGKFSPASRGPKPKRIRGESFDDALRRRTEYMRQPLRARIQINDFDIDKQMSDLTHELGHAIDWDGSNLRTRRLWNSPEVRTLHDRYGKDWMDHLDEIADEETRLVAQLGKQVREAESVKTYLARSDFAYRQYFTSVEEVWARSYAQWVAQASEHPQLVKAMELAKKEHHQFSDDEFAIIGPIIERILRLRGLMT